MGEQFHYRYENPSCSIKTEHYVYRIGSYHFNWHTDYELLCVVAGTIELCVDGERMVLSTDDMVLLNPNEGHATLGMEAGSMAMVIHIDPVFFAGYFEHAEREAFTLRSCGEAMGDTRFSQLRLALCRLMELGLEAAGPDIHYDAELFGLAALIATFPRTQLAAAAYKPGGEAGSMARLTRYIDKHFQERVTLNDLARFSGYNPAYISQLFKSEAGINFSEYLMRVRLAKATTMLSAGSARVADVALAAGFPDVKSFGLAFKRTFGVTPTEYRKMIREDARVNDVDFKLNFIPRDDETVCAALARYKGNVAPALAALTLTAPRHTVPSSSKDASKSLASLYAAVDEARQLLDKASDVLEQAF